MELTEKDLETLRKISWEGGVVDAMEYGISADEFDSKELQYKWETAQGFYHNFVSSSEIFENLLEDLEM